MTEPPAPECLLKKVACGCTANWHGSCGCRKLGITCSMFCKECLGVNCDNPQLIEISEDDVLKEVDEDMDIIQLNTEEI